MVWKTIIRSHSNLLREGQQRVIGESAECVIVHRNDNNTLYLFSAFRGSKRHFTK